MSDESSLHPSHDWVPEEYNYYIVDLTCSLCGLRYYSDPQRSTEPCDSQGTEEEYDA